MNETSFKAKVKAKTNNGKYRWEGLNRLEYSPPCRYRARIRSGKVEYVLDVDDETPTMRVYDDIGLVTTITSGLTDILAEIAAQVATRDPESVFDKIDQAVGE